MFIFSFDNHSSNKTNVPTKIIFLWLKQIDCCFVSLFAAEKRRKRYLWSKSPLPIFSCFNQRRIEYGKSIFLLQNRMYLCNNFMGKVNSEQCRADRSRTMGPLY